MKKTKTPSNPASQSTKLTDATKSIVSTPKSKVSMKPDKHTNPITTVDTDTSVVNANIITETSLFGESAKVITYTGKTESSSSSEVSEVSQPTEATMASELTEASAVAESTVSSETTMSTDTTEQSVSTPTSETSESTDTSVSTPSPKPTRIGKQQRRLEFAEYKEAYLTPKQLIKRHQIWVSEEAFQMLEYYKRVLGDRDTTVTSYGDAIILAHFNDYNADLEAWRKL